MNDHNIFQELASKCHDEDFVPASQPVPTGAVPGSPEKIEVLARRAARGEALWHPDDDVIDWSGAGPNRNFILSRDEPVPQMFGPRRLPE
jgi:hypothetical protein